MQDGRGGVWHSKNEDNDTSSDFITLHVLKIDCPCALVKSAVNYVNVCDN